MYTDEDAIELLDALLKFYSVTLADDGGFDPLDPSKTSVSELAGDLLDSLPRGLITSNYSALKPDALSAGSHYRT